MALNTLYPSKVTDDVWIVARYRHKAPAKAVGKWLIYRDKDEIDALWQKIYTLLRQGQLWSEVKVVAEGRRKGDQFVICVYTSDANNETDVMRIRAILREYGVSETIHYKTDDASWRAVDEYLYSA